MEIIRAEEQSNTIVSSKEYKRVPVKTKIKHTNYDDTLTYPLPL